LATSLGDVAVFAPTLFIAPTVPGDSAFAPGLTFPVAAPSTFELFSAAADLPAVPVAHGAAKPTVDDSMRMAAAPANVVERSMCSSRVISVEQKRRPRTPVPVKLMRKS
jgi:hypothetical protein